MTARLAGGWVQVGFDGDDHAYLEMAFGRLAPGPWRPAFLHVDGQGRRVAQVRPPREPGRWHVWLRVDAAVLEAGHVTV